MRMTTVTSQPVQVDIPTLLSIIALVLVAFMWLHFSSRIHTLQVMLMHKPTPPVVA